MAAAKGELIFEFIYGKTIPTKILFSYPLRFLVPSKASNNDIDCCWVYSLNYGGGLVAGDNIETVCTVGQGCTAAFTTQGSTKVYKRIESRSQNDGQSKKTYQGLRATVASSATLALLPDPFTCFRGANFHQNQEIEVCEGGNLILVDWYTSGRMGRGESWQFERLQSEIRVTYASQLLLWEPLVLEDHATSTVAERMGHYECFCLVIVVGLRFKETIHSILETQGRPTFRKLLNKQTSQVACEDSNCISSACCLSQRNGKGEEHVVGVALKIAGPTTQDVYSLLKTIFGPLESIVGTIPYSSSMNTYSV